MMKTFGISTMRRAIAGMCSSLSLDKGRDPVDPKVLMSKTGRNKFRTAVSISLYSARLNPNESRSERSLIIRAEG